LTSFFSRWFSASAVSAWLAATIINRDFTRAVASGTTSTRRRKQLGLEDHRLGLKRSWGNRALAASRWRWSTEQIRGMSIWSFSLGQLSSRMTVERPAMQT
jgi:hypothetical protein